MSEVTSSTLATPPADRRKRLLAGAGIAAALLIGGAVWWAQVRHFEDTDNAYLRGDITAINPGVGGEIVRVAVKENQQVRAGEVLLEIDPAPYQARLAQAEAMVRVREAALASLDQQLRLQDSVIQQAEAGVVAARAEHERLGKEWSRMSRLETRGYAAQQGLDTTRAGLSTATSGVSKAEASLAAAHQQKVSLETERPRMQAELDAARASARLAEIDLANTQVRAPVDGVAADMVARKGLRVREGNRLLTLVPLSGLWIEANFKETQVRRMRPGQPVNIRVDAFPDQELEGTVESFAPASGSEFALIPVENASGNFAKVVQRVPVRIKVPEPNALSGLLRPGLSVVVDVDTRGD